MKERNKFRFMFAIFCNFLLTNVFLVNAQNVICNYAEGHRYFEHTVYSHETISSIMNHCGYEVNYISHNISSVSLRRIDEQVYISFCICDDTTKSIYYILKTFDNRNYHIVEAINNVPVYTGGIPLLYCSEDQNERTSKTFYKFFKMYPSGEIAHLITVVLPKEDLQYVKSKIPFIIPASNVKSSRE